MLNVKKKLNKSKRRRFMSANVFQCLSVMMYWASSLVQNLEYKVVSLKYVYI